MHIYRSHINGQDELRTETGERVTADRLTEVLLASGSFAHRVSVESEIAALFDQLEKASQIDGVIQTEEISQLEEPSLIEGDSHVEEPTQQIERKK